MDRTSWKPKVFKSTENVDYKAEEEGTSDGAKKGWLTRQRGGSAEEPKKDFVPIDWAGQVGATKSEADQDKASDLMDKYYELVNEPMEDLPSDGSAMEERRSIHAKGVADFKSYLESSGSATVNQDVTDILEDENYHSLNKMLTKEEPETQSSRDKEFYDESTQNTLDTLNQSKVNGFPFFSYVGQPEKIISDGKGGIILYGMKRNPNSIRRIDVKYDEGRDTYTVSFMSNRNKPKGEYNDVYFDQLGGLIAGNKGLGVESYASELKTYNNYNGKLNQEAQDVLRQWVSTLNHSSEVDFYNIPQDVLDTVNKYTSDWMEVETFIETISYYEEDVRGMESKSDKCSYCGKGRMKENPEQCSGCGDVFSSEAKASEYGDAIHSEDGNGWDQGGFFFGIPNMTRDDYEGTVYWKGKPVEHYDHDYFGGDGFEQDMEHDARELAEKCKDLESRGITPTTSSILSGESKASEAQIPCKECGGKGVTNWLGEDEMRCSVCAGTGVIDSEWEDNMDNEEHVYDAPIYIGTNKSWNESKATEISTIDRLRSWDKSEWNQKDINYGYTDAEWNQMSHEEQNRIVDKYEYENEDMWSNMSDQEKNSYESKEGFNQGLYGYVDAKCKTCGIEFDSIPDMDDHYAMNSDHISNLDDLDNDIPNSD